jgi:recombination protein RecA
MDFAKPVSVNEYYSKLSKEDKKSVKKLNEKRCIEFISTGSWVIDRLIGDGTGQSNNGGLPRGHIVEVFGDESCGKTTLGMSACAEAQRMGLVAVWQDYEKTFHEGYAKKLGIDLDKLIFQSPDNFEHGIKLLSDVLVTHPAIIVLDSVSAMIPASMLDISSDDPARIGEQARLMSRFLGQIGKYIPDLNTCLVFINQLRSVIKDKYDTGPKEDTSGGRSIKYYSSVRIKMLKKEVDYVQNFSKITGEKEKTPNNIKIKVTIHKNKIDKPYYSGPVYIRFGDGFDNITSIIDLACTCNVIRKAGAFLRFDSGDSTLFNISGRENLREFLEKNQSILETLSSCVRLKVDEEAKLVGSKEEEEEAQGKSIDAEMVLGNLKDKLEKMDGDPASPEPVRGRKSAKSKN